MSDIKKLKPALVWQFFSEILEIPRPSNKEEKIREYFVKFGTEQNLQTKVDSVGNVLISKDATKGMENLK